MTDNAVIHPMMTPLKSGYLLLLIACAQPPETQEPNPNALPKHVESELQQALAQIRVRVLEIARRELVEVEKNRCIIQLDEVARNLIDDPWHARLKKALVSPAVRMFFRGQLSWLIDCFERKEDGRYKLCGEHELTIARMMDEFEARGVVNPTRIGRLGLTYVRYFDGTLILMDVEDNGPAAIGGLKKDDRIVILQGKRLIAMDVDEVMNSIPPTSEIELSYYRGFDGSLNRTRISARRPK